MDGLFTLPLFFCLIVGPTGIRIYEARSVRPRGHPDPFLKRRKEGAVSARPLFSVNRGDPKGHFFQNVQNHTNGIQRRQHGDVILRGGFSDFHAIAVMNA